MIIDTHNHPDWYGFDMDKFLENMRQNNIDRTWMLSLEQPKDEYNPEDNQIYPDHDESGPVSFRRCMAYAKRHPDQFVMGYAPDPRRPDAVDKLHSAVELYGVRVYGELKLRMMYDNLDAIRMFRYCGKRGLPVIVHLEYPLDSGVKYPRPNWWYGGGIDAFERAVTACPETIFIGHATGFWSHISGNDERNKAAYPAGPVEPGGKLIAMLRSCPNLYCDISARSGYGALQRDENFAHRFLLEFQDRVLYARDNLDNKHQNLLNSLGLPEAVLHKIYSANALKIVPDDVGT